MPVCFFVPYSWPYFSADLDQIWHADPYTPRIVVGHKFGKVTTLARPRAAANELLKAIQNTTYALQCGANISYLGILARAVMYTSRTYAMMPVSVCLSICL